MNIYWKVVAPFYCEMFLYEFPFDNQKCKINLKIKNARADFISWNEVDPIYIGPVSSPVDCVHHYSILCNKNKRPSLR